MAYRLTEHAKDALVKRRISTEWMEQAFRFPEWTEPDPLDEAVEHRLARISEFGGRVLRVVVNVRTIPPRIVTVHFDRRRSRT